MISPRDIIKRMGVGGRLVPFFKCVCVYFALGAGGGEGGAEPPPSLGVAAAKCAPVLCLLLAVALHQHSLPPHQGRYARRVCCALALSALGDALLVWPAQLLSGMAAFAGAHAAYLAALGWRGAGPARALASLAAAALYVRCACGAASGALALLVPLYAALLALVAWRALARGGAAAAGALLFVLSDAILGYSLFSGPVPHRQVLVMSTYYLGQLGLALSALRSPAEEDLRS